MMHSAFGDELSMEGGGKECAVAQENAAPNSATKQGKRVVDAFEHIASPAKGRAFGEEINANYIFDTSLLTMESRDTASTSIATDDLASDCGTEVSSVAMLRGWLDDFGKQNKDHYRKHAVLGKAPEDAELEKPTRPKVRGKSSQVPPTPLPPAAANKLAKRIMDAPSSSISSTRDRSLSRKVRPNHPLRFKAKVRENVQATDDGYASVAKLSAWLADDPTKTKKVRHLRRGANVIAKSRKFDKGLEDVVIEQDNIPKGNVADRADWLEQKSSGSDSGWADFETSSEVVFSSNASSRRLSGLQKKADISDTASAICVNDKRKWLANAFEKRGVEAKAQTEVVTSQDERDAVSSRAKQLWRSKRTPVKRSQRTPTRHSAAKSGSKKTLQLEKEAPKPRSIFRDEPPANESKKEAVVAEEKEEMLEDGGFHAARQLLVQRSRANGNAVDVLSKVQRRKAKFERLQKDVRRKSGPHGLLKPSWEEAEGGRRSSYVKKYVEDICPKKSFEELP